MACRPVIHGWRLHLRIHLCLWYPYTFACARTLNPSIVLIDPAQATAGVMGGRSADDAAGQLSTFVSRAVAAYSPGRGPGAALEQGAGPFHRLPESLRDRRTRACPGLSRRIDAELSPLPAPCRWRAAPRDPLERQHRQVGGHLIESGTLGEAGLFRRSAARSSVLATLTATLCGRDRRATRKSPRAWRKSIRIEGSNGSRSCRARRRCAATTSREDDETRPVEALWRPGLRSVVRRRFRTPARRDEPRNASVE